MIPIIVSGVFALLTSIFVTPICVKYFTKKGYGQRIRIDGPESHQYKSGTPSMGGLAIIFAIWSGYFSAHVYFYIDIKDFQFSISGFILLGILTLFGIVGFVDDFIKVSKNRNLGLTKTGKIVGQVLVSIFFGTIVLKFANSQNITPASTNISFVRNINWINLGVIGFLLFCWIVLISWSNAVNLTDGLDGLAAGSLAMAFGSYVLITFWQYRNNCNINSSSPSGKCYEVRDPLDLSIIAIAAACACVGFLWWNTSPAKIFMGDTGSLALGGLFAGLSILSKTELLALFLGGLFLIEIFSVVIQIIFFKTTGKRVFKMSPIHHHFELMGWQETTVIVRFWIIAGILCSFGLAIFYGEFISG